MLATPPQEILTRKMIVGMIFRLTSASQTLTDKVDMTASQYKGKYLCGAS